MGTGKPRWAGGAALVTIPNAPIIRSRFVPFRSDSFRLVKHIAAVPVQVIEEAILNCCWPSKRLLVLCASAVSTAAAASNIGPTARATISISIVIPPHFAITEAGPPQAIASSNGPLRLCIESNGVRRYHLTLVSGSRAIEDGQRLRTLASATCPFLNAADETGAAYLDPPNQSSQEPLTLLIVPD